MNSSFIVLKALAGNDAPSLNAFQSFLAPHAELLSHAWFSVWCMTAIVVLVKLVREYVDHRRQ
jgi:hypothetical protein